MPLDWKRGRRSESAVAKRTVWASRCGRYRVMHSAPHHSDLSDRFYALRLDGDCWRLISFHRTRNAAESACELNARSERGVPANG